MKPDPKRKVLLVGWDAADWKVIAPLMDAGRMPNLERLVDRGVMGNLSTLYPVLSPMLWTSIATGKRAWKHGIHGFAEPDPQNGGIRPITNASRKCKAIWNILNQCGLKSNIIGWWPTHPAEPINGVMVSDLFKAANASPDHPWPLQKGCVHPPDLADRVAGLRIHPLELEGSQIQPFVPLANEIDQKEDARLLDLAKCLAEASSVHGVATAAMQLEPWDFMAVYYDAIDHFSHGFMQYHPPKLDGLSDEDFEMYKEVVNSAYIFHDMMLGTLMELAGEDTTIILMSDHGFHADHLRPTRVPNEPAGAADEHRQYGIVVMAGPGIKQDDLVFGANLLDITPTILSLFDLPTGRDMDGSSLNSIFEEPPQHALIDSWEDIAGDDGRHPKDFQIDPVDNQEAMQQLVDLGYIERPDEDQQTTVDTTVRELRCNLARAYQGAGHDSEALVIFEELWERWPKEHRFGVNIFRACLKLKRAEKARKVLRRLRENKQKYSREAADELQVYLKGLEAEGKSPNDLGDDDAMAYQKLYRSANVNPDTFAYLEGRLLHVEGKYHAALECFEKAHNVQIHNRPDLHQAKGDAFLALERWAKAESEFRRMLELDAVNAGANLGIARSLLPQKRYQESLEAAKSAVGLLYHQPQAHCAVGLALMQLQRWQEAVDALQIAVAQNPVFPTAHRSLAKIFAGAMKDPAKASDHRSLAEQSQQRLNDYYEGRQIPAHHDETIAPGEIASLGDLGVSGEQFGPLDNKTIVIVSGLPRSGTSMMMQMLDAGGLPVLVDEHRPADDSNERGYFEHESAKRLASDSGWLEQAPGHAVKIIAQLLPNLPQGFKYRIVFMERPLSEVITSQQKLLKRLERSGSEMSADRLADVFQKQITRVRNVIEQHAGRVPVLSVSYDDAIADPAHVVARVNQFLGGSLDESSMADSVAPELRHEESG